MDVESRLRLIEAGMENRRAEIAATERRLSALTDLVLFFIASSEQTVESPAEAALDLLRRASRDYRRRKDRRHADELDELAALLAQCLRRD